MAVPKLEPEEFLRRWEAGEFGTRTVDYQTALQAVSHPDADGLVAAQCHLTGHLMAGMGMILRYGNRCTVHGLTEESDPMDFKLSFPGYEGSVVFATPVGFVEKEPLIELLLERLEHAEVGC